MSIRPFKSTAFAPLSPSRTRVTGYEYHAFPVDKVPDTIPLIKNVNFTSANGTATMCGFSEYTSPSTPPKKYRKQTLSGQMRTCYGGGSNPCPSPGLMATTQVLVLSGSYDYSGIDCSEVNSQLASDYQQSPFICGNMPPLNSSSVPPKNFVSQGTIGGAIAISVVDAIHKASVLKVLCASVVGNTTQAGQMFATLSIEDTEDAAIARSTPSGTGVSAQSYKEPRGAGDFVFLWQIATFNCLAIKLKAGRDYAIVLDLLTQDYGGGGSVLSQYTYNFTAIADDQTVSFPIPVPSGKQATASSPFIHKI